MTEWEAEMAGGRGNGGAGGVEIPLFGPGAGSAAKRGYDGVGRGRDRKRERVQRGKCRRDGGGVGGCLEVGGGGA